ncbi:MAG: hydroxyacylglutathione hydrolase [Gammaproteobacteria bacterium]|nr:hydroxyacylglutathione hydrolase [Gammaproteobacteria bacterium]
MRLTPIPAFNDNYIWLWQVADQAVVVDPGDATPVLAYLEQKKLQLHAILITHHHGDHVGGLEALAPRANVVILPADEVAKVGFSHFRRVADGDEFELLGQRVQVIATPGHTLGHICYFLPDTPPQPMLFCGDTLFSVGCGRLFEGTPTQMCQSLQRLAQLPGDSLVCCAHEYTLGNIRFALSIEPENPDLLQYKRTCEQLRASSRPTLPTTLAFECEANPFLRAHWPSVQEAVAKIAGISSPSTWITWAKLRELKDNFR